MLHTGENIDHYTDNTNIYIYITDTNTNSNASSSCNSSSKMNVKGVKSLSLSHKKIVNIKNKFRFSPAKEYVSYMLRNLIYRYDVSTDNQTCIKLSSLSVQNTIDHNQFGMVVHVCDECKLPCYLFPSINDLSAKQTYTLEEYKVNNRVHLVIQTPKDGNPSLYIHYRHSKNADIDNANMIVTNLLQEFQESI